MLPHSDIARLSSADGAEVSIDDDMFDLLRGSIRYCEQSLGWFDVTVGSLTSLWDFQRGTMLDEDELAERLALVDWRGIVLGGKPGARTARLETPGAMMGCRRHGEGLDCRQADRAFEALRIAHFIINLGALATLHYASEGDPFSIGGIALLIAIVLAGSGGYLKSERVLLVVIY